MDELINRIKSCTICAKQLKHGVNPVVSFSQRSKVAIIGQAPGIKVHQSGIPWDDPSGKRLRDWMDIPNEEFYNPGLFAIVPMGFCYPGRGENGDLPPRKECAKEWHSIIFENLHNIQLVLLIGSYAQNYYLKKNAKRTLTETVKSFDEYLPKYFPLPHPSPRNNIWLKKNSWFERDVVPTLQDNISTILSPTL